MHPVIRIITFLVLAILLARAHPMQMGWVFCVIGIAFIMEKGKGLTFAFRLLWRLRWLFLSIMLLYVWFPVGTLEDSLLLGFERIGLLMMMLFALQVLVLNLPQENIVMGLYRVLWPLSFLGLPRERIVLRLILTIENIASIPEVLREQKNNSDTGSQASRFARISNRLIMAISGVLAHCELASHNEVTIRTDHSVPYWQWSAPVVVVIVYILLTLKG